MNKNLLALSVAVAALASSASAAVSSNIVGYVKLNLAKGLNLIANPLNNTATGGNKISNLFGAFDCSVLRWGGSSFNSSDILAGSGVVNGPDFALAPGESVFVDIGAASAVTLVGEALVGTQTTAIAKGNNFVSSKIPLAGTATDLGLVPGDGDTVLTWNGKSYVAYDYLGGVGWPSGEPSFIVGQGMVVQATAPFAWTKTFIVQ